MREKIGFYGSLLLSLLFCLLLFDAIRCLAEQLHSVPASHKQILLYGFLLWFLSLVAGRNRDDDWAGQV